MSFVRAAVRSASAESFRKRDTVVEREAKHSTDLFTTFVGEKVVLQVIPERKEGAARCIGSNISVGASDSTGEGSKGTRETGGS